MRKTAVVCLAISAGCASVFVSQAAASSAPAKRARDADRSKTTLDGTTRGKTAAPIFVRGELGDVLAYPPADAAKPTIVYLHGVHGRAENGCPWMRAGTREDGWVICPEPKVKDGVGWSWTGRSKDDAPIVHAAIAATRSDAPRVAVGFSQGAYLALDLAKTKRESFRALVLLGADVSPDEKMLASSGVSRVVLAASKDEPWHASVERSAARLSREGARVGIAARFVNLGHVGHMYVAEDPAVLRDAIAWASAP